MDKVAKCFTEAMRIVSEHCKELTHGERMPLVLELTRLMLAQERSQTPYWGCW